MSSSKRPTQTLRSRIRVLRQVCPEFKSLVFEAHDHVNPPHYQHNQLWARLVRINKEFAPETTFYGHLLESVEVDQVASIRRGTFEITPLMVRNVVKLGFELPVFYSEESLTYMPGTYVSSR